MKKFVFIILFATFALVENSVMAQNKPFSNPAIIYGSDFMSFMQSLRRYNSIDKMVQFTSLESIKKFGKEKVKEYYEENFTNMSKLKLTNVTNNSDGTKTLTYINEVFATKSTVSVIIVIENDSCKLVLPTYLMKKLLN